MARRAAARHYGEFSVKIEVQGPCGVEVVRLADFLLKALEIKARDLPVPEPEKPKKPCGCSGS